jgi:hypothetical protein
MVVVRDRGWAGVCVTDDHGELLEPILYEAALTTRDQWTKCVHPPPLCCKAFSIVGLSLSLSVPVSVCLSVRAQLRWRRGWLIFVYMAPRLLDDVRLKFMAATPFAWRVVLTRLGPVSDREREGTPRNRCGVCGSVVRPADPCVGGWVAV